MSDRRRGLRRLARLYGVQPDYVDVEGKLRTASEASLLSVLRVLGAEVHDGGDVAPAVSAREKQLWTRGLPPVIVAWDGRLPELKIRRRAATAAPVRLRLRLESGEETVWAPALEEHGLPGQVAIDGETFRIDRVRPPWTLRQGYHHVRLDAPDVRWSLVIAAPRETWQPPPDHPAAGAVRRGWGVFAPLYALRTERDWGAGDLTDLAALARWVGERGGDVVATLPLLATFLDAPFEPSPYSPASRLFWNELYADPELAEELAECAAARETLASEETRAEIRRLRAAEHVEYADLMRVKRGVIEALAECFFSDADADADAFLLANPEAERYARFRAVLEREGEPWPCWEERLRRGEVRDGDYDVAAYRYHLYAQRLVQRQIEAMRQAAAEAGVTLYLDLPLGVHPDGYDVWAHRDLFAIGVSAGAPPDPFISKGQDWGFPPLKPTAMRETGYAYTIAAVRTHLRHAGALRLDHVMSLHRLFWVPNGREPTEGVYVRYAADELFAILCLESHREQAIVIGEDLGTVPGSIRGAMRRHRVRGMFVAQFSVSADPARALADVPRHVAASVNTHDMPMFAGWWRDADTEDRASLGWLDEPAARHDREQRARQRAALLAFLRARGRLGADAGDDAASVLVALLAELAASHADLVLATLEDLLGEDRPQNVPGTWRERPNWRRKAARTLEEIRQDERVDAALRRIAAERG